MNRVFTLSAIALAISVFSASARIINVPSDYPTIQMGIDSAGTGDTVLVAPGTYDENLHFRGLDIVLASRFIIDRDDSLIANTTINGRQSGCVIRLDSGETVATVIEGFTIRDGHGNYGAGINCTGSSPIIRNNMITNNRAYYCGGGIVCRSGASPQILSNVISFNRADQDMFSNGGGIALFGSSAVIKNNLIIGNSADL